MSDYSIGNALKVTLFGQSHGPAVGCVIEGLPAGMRIDWDRINALMARRAPGKNAYSTPRKETDQPEIISGLNDQDRTCGFPLTAVIRNADTRSGDYAALRAVPRPGHADYTALIKYGPEWDIRGGGGFSARLTAPLCFAGALCMQYLNEKNVRIAAHIARIGKVSDAVPDLLHPALPLYDDGAFPVIDQSKGKEMLREIENARNAGDSVDGEVRCLAAGLPGGLGGPYFGGVEGKLSQALFGIPAVKGLLFGDPMPLGSQNNDPYRVENGKVTLSSNHAGGVLGGISSGAPLHFTVRFKPTPSISLPQDSVDMLKMENKSLAVQGRHDPCVVPRAVPVVEAVTAFVLTDLMLS